MIFFTADTHFCHNNIIFSCKRPFSDVSEMNRIMIENWNSCVTEKDDIYILGDFMYKGKVKDANEILSKLNGRKYLIRGNHEKYLEEPLFKLNAFKWVKDYYVLKLKGKIELVLSHFPMASWEDSNHGSIHLYGHVHNDILKYHGFEEKLQLLGPRAINVGVDVNDFHPVSLNAILDKIQDSKVKKI